MTPVTPRRIALLGAGGFTGRHLLPLLRADGHEVHDSVAHPVDLRSVDSLRDFIRLSRPDCIINLAAVSFVGGNDFRSLYDINAFGVMNLLEVLAETGFTGRLIHASSANIYGNNTPDVITEDRAPEPCNHYSVSKVMSEAYCRICPGAHEVVITRSFSCIGRGQRPDFLVPKIVRAFRQRLPVLELGNIEVRRDFVDIRDAVQVYRRLVDAVSPPSLLQIASNRTASITEIIDTLERIAGFRPEIRFNPAFARPNDLLFQQGDDSRLRALGVQCQHTLEDTLHWIYTEAEDSEDSEGSK